MSQQNTESSTVSPAEGKPDQADKQDVPKRTSDEIQLWIVEYLAAAMEKPADEIDVTVPFDDFALDSATAIGMTGDLEEWLGKSVDPTLVFDYPTIEQFSDCLAGDV